ncbi:unnamed protein product, partial [marine sediment metagenome]
EVMGGIMKAKRCDMCFQDKPGLQPIVPGCPANVCKACAYKITQTMGFLEYHGVGLTYKLPEPEATAKSKNSGS